jgi:hypothetical protein
VFRIFAASAFLLGVIVICGAFFFSRAYTAERKWVPGGAVGERINFKPNFSTALHDCVAAHDSRRLADLDQGHDYRISGWFVDREKTTPVIQCMRVKGWLAVPTSLYTP